MSSTRIYNPADNVVLSYATVAQLATKVNTSLLTSSNATSQPGLVPQYDGSGALNVRALNALAVGANTAAIGTLTSGSTQTFTGSAPFVQFPNAAANQDKLLGTNITTSALEMRATTTSGTANTIVKSGTGGLITAGSSGFTAAGPLTLTGSTGSATLGGALRFTSPGVGVSADLDNFFNLRFNAAATSSNTWNFFDTNGSTSIFKIQATTGVCTIGAGGLLTDGTVAVTRNVATSDSNSTAGHLVLRGVNQNRQLLVGYNTTANEGYIQAVEQGNNLMPLALNAGGGTVRVGGGGLTSAGNIVGRLCATGYAAFTNSGTGYPNATAGQFGVTNASSVTVTGTDQAGTITCTVSGSTVAQIRIAYRTAFPNGSTVVVSRNLASTDVEMYHTVLNTTATYFSLELNNSGGTAKTYGFNYVVIGN